MCASTSAWMRSRILYFLCWCKFLSFLFSTFFLCSSLTWCSLSFSWMNSLPHSSHFTIGWWCMCLAWLIRSTYFGNFSPHWSQTSFSFLWWRIPKLFLYNLKWIAIKRFFTLLAAASCSQSALCRTTLGSVCSAEGKSEWTDALVRSCIGRHCKVKMDLWSGQTT